MPRTYTHIPDPHYAEKAQEAVEGGGGGENLITVELTDDEFADLANTPVVKEIPEITDFSFTALNNTVIGMSVNGVVMLLKLAAFADGMAVWNTTAVSESLTNFAETTQAVYSTELPGYITIRSILAS